MLYPLNHTMKEPAGKQDKVGCTSAVDMGQGVERRRKGANGQGPGEREGPKGAGQGLATVQHGGGAA